MDGEGRESREVGSVRDCLAGVVFQNEARREKARLARGGLGINEAVEPDRDLPAPGEHSRGDAREHLEAGTLAIFGITLPHMCAISCDSATSRPPGRRHGVKTKRPPVVS